MVIDFIVVVMRLVALFIACINQRIKVGFFNYLSYFAINVPLLCDIANTLIYSVVLIFVSLFYAESRQRMVLMTLSLGT